MFQLIPFLFVDVLKSKLKMPKKAGVKKGWQRALAMVCDFKLFLYNMDEEKDSKHNVVVSQVTDEVNFERENFLIKKMGIKMASDIFFKKCCH